MPEEWESKFLSHYFSSLQCDKEGIYNYTIMYVCVCIYILIQTVLYHSVKSEIPKFFSILLNIKFYQCYNFQMLYNF